VETSVPAAGTSPPTGIGFKPWGIPAILVALTVPGLLWASSLGLAISEGKPKDLTDSQIVTGLVLTIILDVVLIALAAWLSIGRHHLRREELGLRGFDRELWWLPLAAAGAAHLAIIIYASILSGLGVGGAVPQQEDIKELFRNPAILPLTGVATVLIAPVAEEIFFRGFVFAGLIRPFGLVGAMLASGLLFGAFHIESADTVGILIPFALIGALFAWIYHRTGSLLPGIATHLLFNLVSFSVLAVEATR